MFTSIKRYVDDAPTGTSPVALLFAGLNGLLFGSSLVVSRFSLGQWQPLTFVAIRLALSALGFVLLSTLVRSLAYPTGRQLWLRGALWGLLGTAVPMSLIVSSMQYQSSGMTSLFITGVPALTAVLAHFFLPTERLNRRQWVGVALAFVGVALLLLSGESGLTDASFDWRGPTMALTAAVASALGIVYARRALADAPAYAVAAARITAAAVMVAVVAAVLEGYDLSAVDAVGYAGLGYASLIGTFAGLVLAVWIIKRFGATAATQTGYVIPVVSTIGGVVFLDERLSLPILLGIAVIFAGLYLVNGRRAGWRDV